jgi:excisionase family DNA binding protein
MKGGYCMGFSNLPEVLTTKQLAEFLHVSDQTIKRAIKAGKLEAFKIGKDWRIEKEAVIKWVKGGEKN